MVTIKNRLEELLVDAAILSGAQKLQAITQIRNYLQQTPCNILNEQLAQIENPVLLRVLQAAGVPACLQARFYVQLNKALKLGV